LDIVGHCIKWDGDQPTEWDGDWRSAIGHPACIEVVTFQAGEEPRTLYQRGSSNV
jgi:hypothetical protein